MQNVSCLYGLSFSFLFWFFAKFKKAENSCSYSRLQKCLSFRDPQLLDVSKTFVKVSNVQVSRLPKSNDNKTSGERVNSCETCGVFKTRRQLTWRFPKCIAVYVRAFLKEAKHNTKWLLCLQKKNKKHINRKKHNMLLYCDK